MGKPIPLVGIKINTVEPQGAPRVSGKGENGVVVCGLKKWEPKSVL
jgi:hypothetical protein